MTTAEGEAAAWLEPEPAATDGRATLTDAQVAAWREQGAVLVDGVLPTALLAELEDDAAAAFPEPGTPAAAAVTDFGSAGRMQFPSGSRALNGATLHPRLLGAVAQLLRTEIEGLRLTQSDLWPKYGRQQRADADRDNDDQRIHVDYPNHTLVHPPAWDRPEAVEIILYLSDVGSCGGATALVPRRGPEDPAYRWPLVGTPGVGDLPWINDRARAEAMLREAAPEIARWREEHLYPRERRARYGRGSVLLYRHDVWHRGTPLHPGARRLAHNLTFRLAASEWISVLHPGWAWAMYGPARIMERLVAEASVAQRCVLGFPAPGHAYWTPDTLAAVAARYGPLGMDLAPYAEALADGPRAADGSG